MARTPYSTTQSTGTGAAIVAILHTGSNPLSTVASDHNTLDVAAFTEHDSLLAKESRFLWRAMCDLRAARLRSARRAIRESLDDIEMVYGCTDHGSLRQRADAVLAELRPAAVLHS